MSLLDQPIPAPPAKARRVFGKSMGTRLTPEQQKREHIRAVEKDHRDRFPEKRAAIQHRHYEKHKEKKARDNRRRYRDRKERLDRAEREVRRLQIQLRQRGAEPA